VIARVLNCHPQNINQSYRHLCRLCPGEHKIIFMNPFSGKRRNFSASRERGLALFGCPAWTIEFGGRALTKVTANV
jgi:hypothetical protein